MNLPARRLLNVAGFLACAGMMGFALYAQHVLLLDPCPLCVFQRVATILTGLVFLVAALHDPRGFGAKVYAACLVLTAGFGVGVASWHVYLQNLPASDVPGCGPGFSGYRSSDRLPRGRSRPGPRLRRRLRRDQLPSGG